MLLTGIPQSAKVALKWQSLLFIIVFGSLLLKGSLSCTWADPVLQRNELWGKNFLGLIVRTES